jgi:hypothetical protein
MAVLAACAPESSPPASPPTISQAGIVTDVAIGDDFVRYTLTDGPSVEIDPRDYRPLTDDGWGGFGLVVIGYDADGPFVASFPTQQGLPADCYVENEEGTERGEFIEIHGVLWQKAADFNFLDVPDEGAAYPGGTRFCLDEAGSVSAVIPR